MGLVSKILIGLIAIEHLYILYIEMFSWEKQGKKKFKTIPEHLFTPTKKMAANQGLYNGFLAAGLIWAMGISNHIWQLNVSVFFLSCIAIAGIYGGVSVSKNIFFVQAIPAFIALICLHISL